MKSENASNRRQFLKEAGQTAVAASLFSFLPYATPEGRAEILSGNYETAQRIFSCCNMCGGQTGIECLVLDGKVAAIRPNSHNPNGFSNISEDFAENAAKEGAVMCPKGNSGIMTLYDPDRVKTPMRRTNPDKGIGVDPKWKEISWEEAYGEIVDRLRKLREAGDAHKLLWFSEDHSFTHIQADFCKLYGTPNNSIHSNLCDVSRKASFKTVMGHDRPLADALHSKYLLIFGWNPLSATKWSHLPRIFTRARQNGAKLVVLDPYFSYTSSRADEWIPIRPSTDGAFALAMGHVIIRDHLYDEDFVRNWTVGFDEYASHVQDKTPKWAEAVTSVPAETIERIAREFATTKPSLLDVWSGVGQHSNGVQGGRAIACVAALTGGYDRPGTLIIPDKKGNKHIEVDPDRTAEATLKQQRFDDLKAYPLGNKSGVYCEAMQRLANDKGIYQPKMAIIIFQNLMMSVPGTHMVEKALKKLDFIVVNDIFVSETAQMADILIPGTTYLERYDLNSHWVTWPVLGLRQPVVKPIFGQPAEYEFVMELGRRLGIRDKHGNDIFRRGAITKEPIEDKTTWYEEYLSRELKEGEPKITLDELKALPGATWVSTKGTNYEKFKKEIPSVKLGDTLLEEGVIYSKKADGGKDKPIGLMVGKTSLVGFDTPSRKVEFTSKALEGKKDANGKPVNPLPVYEPRDWQPTKEYPFYLINWKEASHTHSRSQNNVWLMELKPDNPLKINVDVAKRFGIQDGDEVWIESPYGKIKSKVSLTQGIHPEVIGLQHGFGHWAMGKVAKGKGSLDAFLRPTVADPISGQALHKECCVKIYKV